MLPPWLATPRTTFCRINMYSMYVCNTLSAVERDRVQNFIHTYIASDRYIPKAVGMHLCCLLSSPRVCAGGGGGLP